MAHNPPIPARLDIMDRLGMLAMDENRDYGGHQGQGGTTAETVAEELVDMGDMVQRDRSHPSVMLWSFCNEVVSESVLLDRTCRSDPTMDVQGCNNESSAALFRNIAYYYDGTHLVTQNHLGHGEHPLSMKALDVQVCPHLTGMSKLAEGPEPSSLNQLNGQGFSHKDGSVFDEFHKANPEKPMLASESCSSPTGDFDVDVFPT